MLPTQSTWGSKLFCETTLHYITTKMKIFPTVLLLATAPAALAAYPPNWPQKVIARCRTYITSKLPKEVEGCKNKCNQFYQSIYCPVQNSALTLASCIPQHAGYCKTDFTAGL
eukprot:Protomagalhaensia_wolfi_Nauph_80__2266@NODE_247_length_3063_cov_2671_756944_g172_i1_p4_GENE_NODE_247_length_3063_cov_2671_756944_g172_i1NODE_247_length_3063_cov_2671_756944_g172_i1_p4_ORF_typecomplete_len113_score9_61_NODE_247_length_3063_cov_2671_756944_g172_i114301768